MAFSKSQVRTTVFGNERVTQFVLTTDAVSGVVDTGLSNVFTVATAGKSMTSGASFRANELTAATASPGKLHIVNCTSGDDIYVTCFGN